MGDSDACHVCRRRRCHVDRPTPRLRGGAGVIGCAALALPAAGQTAPYRFDLLSERTGFAQGTNLIRSLPALNDNGTAAFILGEPAAYYGHTLFTGTPGALTRVETPGVLVGGGVSINNHGRMDFIGIATGTTFPDLFAVSAGGPIVPISNGASFGSFDPDANGRLETAISDGGAVMALADQPQRFPSTVVIGDGTGPARAVFRTSPAFPETGGGAVELTSPRMSTTGDWTAHEINFGSPAFSTVTRRLLSVVPVTPPALRTNAADVEKPAALIAGLWIRARHDNFISVKHLAPNMLRGVETGARRAPGRKPIAFAARTVGCVPA